MGEGDGLAAGVAEGLAEAFEDFDDLDLDLDFAARQGAAKERQRTPATKKERIRAAFIVYQGAG